MNSKNSNGKGSVLPAMVGGIFSVAMIGLVLWLNFKYIGADENRGTFGDMFGGANALFSGLAFSGIIITIILQMRELGYQREELKATRSEFKLQNKTLKMQLFENTFFNMVTLHNQIINDIDYDSKEKSELTGAMYLKTVRGRDVFRNRFNVLHSKLKNKGDHSLIYENFYEERKTDFGHYFRNLYRIFKLIDDNEFISYEELGLDRLKHVEVKKYDEENFKFQYKYASIIRAQLSDYELLILFYNGLSKNGKEFKKYIEKYSLLDNMDQEEIKNPEWLREYEEAALKSSWRRYQTNSKV